MDESHKAEWKETKHERTHTIWFHLYKVQMHAKLIYSVKWRGRQ